jgi:hypothetical protein
MSDLYGVRVLGVDPSQRVVRLRVVVLYYEVDDHAELPDDASFFLRVLHEYGSGPLGQLVTQDEVRNEAWVDTNSPVDRARPGSKHHLSVDRHGTPLALTLTGGNRHHVTQLLPLLDAVPSIRGRRVRPRRKPDACTPTGATTSTSIAACCGSEASSR